MTDNLVEPGEVPSAHQQAIGTVMSSEWVEVRPSRRKGYGLFAKKDISKGTCVFQEMPLIIAASQATAKDLHNVLQAMLPEQVAKFRQFGFSVWDVSADELVASHLPNSKTINDDYYRVLSNAQNMQDQRKQCMYELFTRANHSCTPNLQPSFDDTPGRLSAYVTCDVAADEELCRSYIKVETSREMRRAMLEQMHIKCICRTCREDHDVVHDGCRTRINVLKNYLDIHVAGSMDDPVITMNANLLKEKGGIIALTHDEAFSAAEQYVDLLRKEKLTGCYLSYGYCYLAEISTLMGRYDEALGFAEEARRIEVVCFGPGIAHKAARRNKGAELIDKITKCIHERESVSGIDSIAIGQSSSATPTAQLSRTERRARERAKKKTEKRGMQSTQASPSDAAREEQVRCQKLSFLRPLDFEGHET